MNDDKRRYVPWSRETDKTAAIVAAILALLGGDILSSSGAIRMGKFTRSDFDREIAYRDDRIGKLEVAIPDDFPPIQWQVEETQWRTGIQAQIDAIRNQDRQTTRRVDELRDDCANNINEFKAAQSQIQINNESIKNLWRWMQHEGIGK